MVYRVRYIRNEIRSIGRFPPHTLLPDDKTTLQRSDSPGDCATADRAMLLCSPLPRRTGITFNGTFFQECFFRL
jgi:hypothetical protein